MGEQLEETGLKAACGSSPSAWSPGCPLPGAVSGPRPASALRARLPYLGQPVPQRLDHDAAVVVALLLVGAAQLLHPEAGDGEQAQVVPQARVQGRDEVREAEVRVGAGRVLLCLKPEAGRWGGMSRDVALHSGQQHR